MKKITTIRVEKELLDRMDNLGKIVKRSRSNLIRRAIEEFLRKYETRLD